LSAFFKSLKAVLSKIVVVFFI